MCAYIWFVNIVTNKQNKIRILTDDWFSNTTKNVLFCMKKFNYIVKNNIFFITSSLFFLFFVIFDQKALENEWIRYIATQINENKKQNAFVCTTTTKQVMKILKPIDTHLKKKNFFFFFCSKMILFYC